MSEKKEISFGAPETVPDGPLKGWLTWGLGGDPFETLCGPLCFREEPDGSTRSAFIPEHKHLNGGGVIHGGALMTFADFALFAIGHHALAGQSAVTVTFNCELVGAGTLDGLIIATGRVIRETGSLLFVQGVIEQNGKAIMAFSGTLKKIRKR